jgi:hypothetical protein
MMFPPTAANCLQIMKAQVRGERRQAINGLMAFRPFRLALQTGRD